MKNVFFMVAFIVAISSIQAQVQNDGVLHVADNGFIFIESGVVTFGTSSATTTSKTAPYAVTDGKIILGAAATFSTDGSNTKFVNGYAETRNTTATLLAIGASTIYAPIQVTAATNTSGVRAAYFNTAPLTAYAGGLDISVTALANTEYWIAKGENAVVTLSWRAASNLTSILTSPVGLTIVGYKSGKWEAIASDLDVTSVFGGTSTLSGSGSITTNAAVDLSLYEAFAIGEKNQSLSNTDFGISTVAVVLNNNTLSATSSSLIKSITLYDLTGRVIATHNAINAASFTAPFYNAQGIYIAKIHFENGALSTQKLINTK